MQKDFWRELFRPENKKMRSNVFLALMAGILLLGMGKSFFAPPAEEQAGEEIAAEASREKNAPTGGETETERRMAEILSQIEGAGQVKVMLTFRTTEEKSPALEEKTEETREEENGSVSQSLRKETAVVLLEDGKGNTAPLILTEQTPRAEGVVIVAEGGGNPTVCNALNSAAQALLDVPAHKIAVLKMK